MSVQNVIEAKWMWKPNHQGVIKVKCPKCESEEKVKNGFKNSMQRYKCKRCGYHYTKSQRYEYAMEVKRKTLKHYLEGIGFRRIEKLLEMGHVTVISWVKKMGEKIKYLAFEKKKAEKVDVLELDELCINLKKLNKKWIWLAAERASQQIKEVYLGPRSTSSFKKLLQKIF